MGFKIGGISLPKLPNVNEVAELAIKANMPLSNLNIAAKVAEFALDGVLRKTSLHNSFIEQSIKAATHLDIADGF